MANNKAISSEDLADEMVKLIKFKLVDLVRHLNLSEFGPVTKQTIRCRLSVFYNQIDSKTGDRMLEKIKENGHVYYICTDEHARIIKKYYLNERQLLKENGRKPNRVRRTDSVLCWGDKIIGKPGTTVMMMGDFK